MINFCTLFNSNYLARALVMFDSLEKNCSDFHLYVFAFDDETYKFLKLKNYKKLTPISLQEFEDEELLRIKSSRSMAEYCWTCTPSTIYYCFNSLNLENCTYIDADMFFYSNPIVLINELENKSILLTEHRYSANHDHTEKSGKYCVQFMTFKNNVFGNEAINWWRKECIKWCYAKHEDGKFGDQKYLDDWLVRFNGVHELQNLGGGLAPWNITQYELTKQENVINGQEIKTKNKFTAVFYHFHGLKFYNNNTVSLTESGYYLSKNTIEIIYKPYIRLLIKKENEIRLINNNLNSNGSNNSPIMMPMSYLLMLKIYFNTIKIAIKNIYPKLAIRQIKTHNIYYLKNLI